MFSLKVSVETTPIRVSFLQNCVCTSQDFYVPELSACLYCALSHMNIFRKTTREETHLSYFLQQTTLRNMLSDRASKLKRFKAVQKSPTERKAGCHRAKGGYNRSDLKQWVAVFPQGPSRCCAFGRRKQFGNELCVTLRPCRRLSVCLLGTGCGFNQIETCLSLGKVQRAVKREGKRDEGQKEGGGSRGRRWQGSKEALTAIVNQTEKENSVPSVSDLSILFFFV